MVFMGTHETNTEPGAVATGFDEYQNLRRATLTLIIVEGRQSDPVALYLSFLSWRIPVDGCGLN